MVNFVRFICAPDWGSITDNFPTKIGVCSYFNDLKFDQTIKHTQIMFQSYEFTISPFIHIKNKFMEEFRNGNDRFGMKNVF